MLLTLIAPGRLSWLGFVPALQERPLAARRAADVLGMVRELGEPTGGCLVILVRPDGTLGVRDYLAGAENGAWVGFSDGKPLNQLRLFWADTPRPVGSAGPYRYGI